MAGMGLPEGIHDRVRVEYPDYLRDESRRAGTAETISFPRSPAELQAHLVYARAAGQAVTVQGARTGITGASVPDGGHVLNLSKLTAVSEPHATGPGPRCVTAEPGVTLETLRQALETAAGGQWFFPPDPTETSASVGGMIATNASGARTLRYGPTRRYVTGLRLVLADGDRLSLVRGQRRADGRRFRLETDGGRTIEGDLPHYTVPDVKSAAGYFVADDMDLLDLFIGAEGTLGVVAEADLLLAPAPPAVWGLQAFLPDERAALAFVRRVREAGWDAVAAIEFFDARALDLLREQKRTNPAFSAVPDMPPAWHTAIYVELHGNEEAVEETMMNVSAAMVACGGDEDATWLAADSRELERLKSFRHAVPEAVNLLIDQRRKTEPALTKLGTDLAVPDAVLEEMFAMYHADLDQCGLDYVIFGHVGNNHVHVNLLPRSRGEYERGKAVYLAWAQQVAAWGGTVSAEHGIGKLKTAMLEAMYGSAGIDEMRRLKALFDPEGRLNPGTLFPFPRSTR